ncbi:TonB-dependent receptor [Pseudomaricurvus sp. HS19]|uniref:TonB-dependent receptor n=1 Tax=Pseudomaricurvus sp. HS19 TaxID=2692626 RepID=UPI0013703FA8|nr:TonB-dependent receptor [Pseudomaricurvus sp. HS19]MYM63801.1 TonB-dependent receptor [Pseudomaricurvus sp. HS19]
MVVFPKRQLALAVALSVQAAAGSAQQATTVAATAAAAPMEEIVVAALPIRDSQQAAIMAKRDADNYVDVVSADTIGRFPDQNLADSLARVPGLAVERDQGQARYVNFRGAPFRYTSLSINGIQLPGAENGRVPRFDSFPAVITGRIEANKAITAAMPGESIAGYINIDTFSPFAKEGFGMALDIGTGKQDLGDGDIDTGSLRLSWSNDNWGVMVYGSKDSREQVTDNREYDLTMDAATGLRNVNEIQFRNYLVERENKAYGGQLEYRFDDGISRVFVSNLYSEFVDHEQRNQFVFGLQDGAGAMGSNVTPGDSGYEPLVLVQRWLQDGEYSNSTDTTTLGADFQLGEWLLETRLNYTETDNKLDLPIILSAGGTVAADYDVSDLQDPSMTLYQRFTTTPLDLSDVSYSTHLGMPLSSLLEVESTQWQLDGSREWRGFGLDHRLQVGVRLDQRESEGYALSTSRSPLPAGIDIDSFNTNKPWDSDFDNGVGGTYYDNAGLLDAWIEAAGGSIAAPVADDLIVQIEEDITAFYAMNTSQFSWGSLVYGVRVENTDYTSSGPDANYSDSFTNVLPSVHWNYDLTEDQKLRVSLTSGISRPTYNEWRASASVNALSETISGGNPALEAEEAWGMDVSWEWYLGDGSLLAVGGFYRDIDNVIYNAVSTIDAGIYSPANTGETWDFIGTVNGDDGYLQGLELNLIAQFTDVFGIDYDNPLSGFGFSANASVLDSEFTTLEGEEFSLPGTSDLVYNASFYYENESFSARLNYQYRDDWLTATESAGMAQYWAPQKRLDLSLRYTLPVELPGAEVSLYFNANNLTDAVDERYTGSEDTPDQVERYGRRYQAGVRVNF